ncbi:MAG TPA: hypothetical protein VFU23_07990, partial [Gemmatimonadales bacterium]|nr:hypothetical protein [Gemmatimonadales bacterium]
MNNRGILLSVLGFGTLFYVLGGSRTVSVSPAPAAPAPDTTRRTIAPRFLSARTLPGFRLIQQYLGVPLGQVDSAARPPIEVLIATVADPYDSHLDWSYDAAQEAIRRAFESSGYVLDRFWIPDAKETVIDTVNLVTVSARTQYPGVMLFRDSVIQGRTGLHLVYLVGETPTAGIHRQAFLTALRERDSLMGWSPSPGNANPDLHIVGPMFSGSTRSLRRLLEIWWRQPGAKRPGTIRVISGSATSVDVAELEGRRAGSSEPSRVTFRSTVQSDASFLRALDTLAERLHIEPGQVAVLSEGSTEYGRRVGDVPGSFITVPFPMNISSLREEYEKHPNQTEGQHLALGTSSTSRAPLSLEEDRHTSESPTPTSRLSVPAIEQLVSQILRTLDQHDVRLVAILATDVRDKLFLAGEIKKELRGVQLVTSESNVLYLRPDRYRSLHGMIVLSTYPLILENQQWTRNDSTDGGPVMPFANEGAEGVYNAVLLQLGNVARLVDYQPPGAPETRRPPVWITAVGSASFVPLMFLTGLTDTGYVHAGRVPPADTAGARHWTESYQPVQMSDGQKGLVGLLALLVFVVAVNRLLILSSRRRRNTGTGGWPKSEEPKDLHKHDEYLSRRARIECSSLEVQEQFYGAVQLVGLLGVLLPAASAYIALSRAGPGQGSAVLLMAVGGFAVAAFLLAAGRSVRLLYGTRARDIQLIKDSLHEPTGWSWIVEVVTRYGMALITAGYLILIVLMSAAILRMGLTREPQSWMFFVRAIQIDGELSPLPPLMLSALAFAWWATWHLKRVELLRIQTPFELLFTAPHRAPTPELTPVEASVRETRHLLFMMVPGVSGLLIGLWLLLVLNSLRQALSAPTLERWLLDVPPSVRPPLKHWLFHLPTFDWLLTVGILATLVAIPWGVCRLYLIWHSLREYLECLRELPLVTAFDRLPPRIAGMVGFSVIGGSPRGEIGAMSRLQWSELRNITAHRLEKTIEPKPSRADAALLTDILACMAAMRPDDDGDTPEAAEHRLRLIYPVLRSSWNSEPIKEEILVLEKAVQVAHAGGNPD